MFITEFRNLASRTDPKKNPEKIIKKNLNYNIKINIFYI